MRTLFYGSCIIIVFSLALNTLPASSEKTQESSNYVLEINGKFNIPLVIHENLGVERKKWPVSFGVPFPPGLVREPVGLRLLDSAGNEVECQFQVLNRHWARDNSIRWLLLDFQADVPANGKAVYKLTNDKPGSPIKDGIVIEQKSEAITVKTGKLETRISTKRCSLFEKVSFANTEIIQADQHDGPSATTEEQSFTRVWGGDWNLHGWSGHKTAGNQRPIKRADYFGDIGEPDEVVIERNGPMHVIIRVRGVYRSVEKGPDILEHGPYNFTYRLHFYKDKNWIRVEHSVENSRFQEPRFQTKLLQHSLVTSHLLRTDYSCTWGDVVGEGGTETVKGSSLLSLYGEKVKGKKVQWMKLASSGKQFGIALRTWCGEAQALDIDGKRLVVSPYSIYWGEAHPLSSLTEKSWGSGVFALDFGSRKTYDIYYCFGNELNELPSFTKAIF